MTRSPEFISSFLRRVEEVWKDDPDSRFGQFASNTTRAYGHDNLGLEQISDEAFLLALDTRAQEQSNATIESKADARPLDPARIAPFLDQLAAFWVNHPERRFGELVVGILPLAPDPDRPDHQVRVGLRLIEEAAFLELVNDANSMTASQVFEQYIHRGPLGDLLARMEEHEP